MRGHTLTFRCWVEEVISQAHSMKTNLMTRRPEWVSDRGLRPRNKWGYHTDGTKLLNLPLSYKTHGAENFKHKYRYYYIIIKLI